MSVIMCQGGYLVQVQLEAEAGATLLNDRGADVGGHDQQCVLEVHSATFAVCQPSIFKNLCHITPTFGNHSCLAVIKMQTDAGVSTMEIVKLADS